MTNFTPVPALAGGALIGLSASILLLANGRVAGIAGILGSLARPQPGDVSWRLVFLAAMGGTGVAASFWWPEAVASSLHRSPGMLVAAGLLVGFGTRLGSGCTSGHGVCGLARLSWRSLASVLTFMGTGFVATWLLLHVLGVS